MSDSSPPIAPPPLPIRNSKYQEMARASWLAPIIAMAVNFALVSARRGNTGTTNIVQIVIGPLFIFGGLILGFVALFRIRKFGKREILVPALVGICLNLLLVVMAALPLLLLPKRTQLQPAVHSPTARLLKDERLRLSMDVPEGFKDFPEGKRTPTLEYVFIEEIPGGGEARMVITVERMNGFLSKKKPLTLENIRKHAAEGVNAHLVSRNWRGLKVDSIIATVEQNGVRMVVQTIQVPLIPSAIQLGVAGPESKRAEVDRLTDTLLASLEGNTNW